MSDIVKNWILIGNNDFKTGKDEMATEEPATDTNYHRNNSSRTAATENLPSQRYLVNNRA